MLTDLLAALANPDAYIVIVRNGELTIRKQA